MKYVSSRKKNTTLKSYEAVVQGLSKEGGLFTPMDIDTQFDISSLLQDSYQQLATKIIHTFLNDYTQEEIQTCVQQAYDDKFDTKEIVPLRKLSDCYLMELWHGPTSAFKDIALTILPFLLTTGYQKQHRTDIVSILTATSGDTGKAALSGFQDVKNTAITVFYPEIGVSEIQKRQMQTSLGKNVEVIALKGNFDDCQRLVKEATQNKEVLDALDHVVISSANSINIGRLVPQIVYYFSSYIKLVNERVIDCGQKINFVVPTGNFGDILAGYLASCIGLPINKLICASNTNHVLTDFLRTGTYSINRTFTPTISPSMDILISSNLERLLFMMSDYDDTFVNNMMESLKDTGSYTIPETMLQKIQEKFIGYYAQEEACKQTIHDTFLHENTLIDPHTSVAVDCYHQYLKDTNDTTPTIVLSTASPYKFCTDVYASLTNTSITDGFEAMEKLYSYTNVPIPQNLSQLKDMPIRFTRSIEIKDGMKVIAQRMQEISHVND